MFTVWQNDLCRYNESESHEIKTKYLYWSERFNAFHKISPLLQYITLTCLLASLKAAFPGVCFVAKSTWLFSPGWAKIAAHLIWTSLLPVFFLSTAVTLRAYAGGKWGMLGNKKKNKTCSFTPSPSVRSQDWQGRPVPAAWETPTVGKSLLG